MKRFEVTYTLRRSFNGTKYTKIVEAETMCEADKKVNSATYIVTMTEEI